MLFPPGSLYQFTGCCYATRCAVVCGLLSEIICSSLFNGVPCTNDREVKPNLVSSVGRCRISLTVCVEGNLACSSTMVSWIGQLAGQVFCGHSLPAVAIGTRHAAMRQNLQYMPASVMPVLCSLCMLCDLCTRIGFGLALAAWNGDKLFVCQYKNFGCHSSVVRKISSAV